MTPPPGAMSVFHDEVEIEDFEYDEETETYSYPCPCGDRFLITRVTAGGREGRGGKRRGSGGEVVLGRGPAPAGVCGSVTVFPGPLQEDLENGEDVATCPSCSLIVRVIYDQVGAGRGPLPAAVGRPSSSSPPREEGAVAAFKGPW